MLIFKNPKQFLKIFLMLGIFLYSPICKATLDYELISGLDFNWYFENDSTTWERFGNQGYFHDYNGDGLQDYLFVQKDTGNQSRIFCIDTSNSEDPKTYETDKTAWRVIDWVEGTFIPRVAYFRKKKNELRTPDIVLYGRDRTDNYSKFILKRLDETDTAFPDEKTWNHVVNKDYNPDLDWRDVDFNDDAYPDYLIYNHSPDGSGKFIIGFYNGLDGSEIWTASLDKSADDIGISIPGMTTSNVQVMLAGTGDRNYSDGDFDGDGKPEIVIYYTFMYINPENPMEFYYKGLLHVLKSDGSDYYAGGNWWEIYDYNIMAPLAGATSWDYNMDGSNDFHVINMGVGTNFDIPVLQTFDIKNKTYLFSTTNSDFGATIEDITGFAPMPVMTYDNSTNDFEGDGVLDLVFNRMFQLQGQDISYGLFHGYAGGGANAGKKIWLTQEPDYNYCIYGVNDWNSDNFMDHFLIKNPAEPGANKVQWDYKLPFLDDAAPGEYKTFSYAADHDQAWNASTDAFISQTIAAGLMGDIDGDGQKDTMCSEACYFDTGDDNTTDFALNRVYLFDNTPADQEPDITAEMEISVTGEDIDIASMLMIAYDFYKEEYIDQNGDGSPNDIIVNNQRAVFGLSFQYTPSTEVTKNDIMQVITGSKTIPTGQQDDYDKNGDGICDVADIIWMMK